MASHSAPDSATPTMPTPAPTRSGGLFRSLMIVVGAIVIAGGAVTLSLFLAGSGKPAENAGGASPASSEPKGNVEAGRLVTMKYGCVTCHSADGSRNRGPTYLGLFGSNVTYDDGSTGVIDAAEVRDALAHPTAKIIEGFEGIMPKQTTITEPEIVDLIAYLKSIGNKG